MSLPYLARVGQRADLALGTPGVVSSAHAQQFSIVVIAPNAPPPRPYDTIPPPPTADAGVMNRHAGHWMWDAINGGWEAARYVERPAPTPVWEPGPWSREPSGGFVRIDGHWRS